MQPTHIFCSSVAGLSPAEQWCLPSRRHVHALMNPSPLPPSWSKGLARLVNRVSCCTVVVLAQQAVMSAMPPKINHQLCATPQACVSMTAG